MALEHPYILRLTADASGDASDSITAIGGIVSYIAIDPQGSVDAGSTAAVTMTGGGTNTKKAATSCSSFVELIGLNSGHFSITRNNTLNVVIASAAEDDQFIAYIHIVRFDE